MATKKESFYEVDESCKHLNFLPYVRINLMLIQQGFGEGKGTSLFAKVLDRVFKERSYIDDAIYEFPQYADKIEEYFDLDDPKNYHYLIDGEENVYEQIDSTRAFGSLSHLSLNDIGYQIIQSLEESYQKRVDEFSRK